MKRLLFALLWIFTFTIVSSAQTTFYFPQIANGVQGGGVSWRTTIFITNPAPSGGGAVSGSITFTGSDGSAFNLSFVDSNGAPVGAGNTIPFQIAGGQSRKFVSTGQGELRSGFGVVTANGTINGTAVFTQQSGNSLIGEAGVPAASLVGRQSIFVDEQAGFITGVAYANPNSASANITLQLLNTEGNAVVQSTTRTLNANQHTAAFVGDVFPGVVNVTGTMQINSNTPLAAIALRFSPSGPFTTLPPVTLAELVINPALLWLEKRNWLSPVTSLARLLAGLQVRMG